MCFHVYAYTYVYIRTFPLVLADLSSNSAHKKVADNMFIYMCSIDLHVDMCFHIFMRMYIFVLAGLSSNLAQTKVANHVCRYVYSIDTYLCRHVSPCIYVCACICIGGSELKFSAHISGKSCMYV